MTRCMPSAMEWLALSVLLGIALPTAGEIFESSLDRTSSKLSFQCAKVTAAGCRKQNPDTEVVLNSLIGSFGSGISCALNRSVGTSFRDLEYFFNENCLTKPIKIVILRLDESQIQEEATKTGCFVATQRLSKLTVQYGCVSRTTVTTTLTQPTAVHNETAVSSRAQSTAAIYTLPSIVTTGLPKQAMTSSLPSAATMSLSTSTGKTALTTAHDKGVLSASTNARPTAAWSTAVDKTATLPLTSSGASGRAEGTTATMRLENSEKATTGPSNQEITSSFSSASASTMLLTRSSSKTNFATTHDKIALSTSTNVRPSAAWSTREAESQMTPITSSGTTAITTGINVTGRLENSDNIFEPSFDHTSATVRFQCTDVTVTGCRKNNPYNEVVLNSLIASFDSDIHCALNTSVGTVYRDLAYFFNENCLTTSNKVGDVRFAMSQITQEATKSGCRVTTQRLSKLTVHFGCSSQSSASIMSTQPTTVHSEASSSFPHHRTTALYTLPSIVITASSKEAITVSLPSASTVSLSQSTINTKVTTAPDKSALSTPTLVRPSAAWSTRDVKTLMASQTSSGASETATGIIVTLTLENSASTTINISDRMMNQSLSTEPANRMNIPSQVVSNNEDWWQFFKTNEGITVAMVSLLVLCLTICGLALIFYSRTNKGTKRPGKPAPSGAFATTATYHEHAKGVPNGEEHAAELGINACSTLYADAAAYGRPSVRPITTNEVLEHQGTLSLTSKSSFDGPARRQSAANGCNFASEPVVYTSPGGLHEDEHCAAIGDATGMLRPLEERRVSDQSPSVTRDQKQSAVEMTSEPTAGRGSGGMLAIENEEAYRASHDPLTTQFENIRAEATQQLHANPQADETQQTSECLPQKAWSASEGSPKATPDNSFPVALNVDVGEKSMDTAL